MERKKEVRCLSMLIAAMVIYGTIGIFRRYIPLSSGILAFARGIIGTLFLVPVMLLRKEKPQFSKIGKKIWLLVLTGALIGFNWMFLFEAYNYTTVATATLCYYMQPIIVILAAPLVFGEKLTLKKGICVAIALLGMVFVSGVAENGIPAAGELKGILFGLLAALIYASVVMLNKKIVGVGTYEKTVIQLFSAAVVMIPYLLLTEDFSTIQLDTTSILMLFVVGVIHTGLAYALYFGSMGGLKAQTVALFSYIDPVVAILLSALLLKEEMTIFGIVGAVLVLGATVVSEMKSK